MTSSQRTSHDRGLPTTTSLLDGLVDGANDGAWSLFTRRYRPVIIGYGRRIGLNHTDAEDLAQLTLTEFSQAYLRGAFDRRKGRLRNWLFGIVRNQMRSQLRTRAKEFAKTVAVASEPVREAPEAIWEDHWRATILERCLQVVAEEFEPTTMESFRLFAILQCPAAAVAAELGVTENAVYLAKRRVLGRIRALADQMEKDE